MIGFSKQHKAKGKLDFRNEAGLHYPGTVASWMTIYWYFSLSNVLELCMRSKLHKVDDAGPLKLCTYLTVQNYIDNEPKASAAMECYWKVDDINQAFTDVCSSPKLYRLCGQQIHNDLPLRFTWYIGLQKDISSLVAAIFMPINVLEWRGSCICINHLKIKTKFIFTVAIASISAFIEHFPATYYFLSPSK